MASGYENEEIVRALTAARLAKGLSQRALGERVGLPQSHISKIERGGSDVQLSSLVQLARALDLELKLVPRTALPAVDTVVKSAEPREHRDTTSRALDRIHRAQQLADRFSLAPARIPALDKFQRTLALLERQRFTLPDLSALTKALEPIETLNRRIAELNAPLERFEKVTELAGPIGRSNRSLEQLRSRIANDAPEPRQLPAHRLDEDEDA